MQKPIDIGNVLNILKCLIFLLTKYRWGKNLLGLALMKTRSKLESE